MNFSNVVPDESPIYALFCPALALAHFCCCLAPPLRHFLTLLGIPWVPAPKNGPVENKKNSGLMSAQFWCH